MLRTARLGEEKREGVPQRLANTLLVQPAQRLIVQPACALTQALRRAYAEGDNNTVMAGTIARTLAQLVVHPIDTIKTRLQVSEPPKKLLKWRRKLLKQKNQLVMSVGLSGRTMTVPNWAFKGPGDIYRGATGALLGTFPTALVYFLVYDRVSTAFKDHAAAAAEAERANPRPSPSRVDRLSPCRVPAPEVRHLVSASTGALASSVVRVPGDTIRHQTQAFMHRNVFAAFRNIVAARGVGGLYLGYLPTLMRDIPELAVQFTLYELMRTATVRRHAEAAAAAPPASRRRRPAGDANAYKPTTIEHLVMGGIAGASAAVFTMPLDFVKTRQQCGAVGGIVGLMRAVVAAEGVGGLFHGLVPRVGMAATTSAVFFGLFEGVKMVLKPASERSAVDADFVRKLTLKRREQIWKRQVSALS